MSKVAVLFADGCEEIEGLTVVDMLRRAKIEVTMVSIMGQKEIHGSHDIVFQTDELFEEADFDRFDGIVLPGGVPGVDYLGDHAETIKQLQEFYSKKKLVAAICAAPSVLGRAGILKGVHATCHPGWEEKLTGALLEEESAVTDANVITSRGMGTAIDFSLAIIRYFADEAVIEQVRKGIVY